AGRREEHLRLVLEAPEGLAVDDAIAIALERRPDVVFGFGTQAAARLGALRRLRREDLALAGLELFAERTHTEARPRSKNTPRRHEDTKKKPSLSFVPSCLRGRICLRGCILVRDLGQEARPVRQASDSEELRQRLSDIGERPA